MSNSFLPFICTNITSTFLQPMPIFTNTLNYQPKYWYKSIIPQSFFYSSRFYQTLSSLLLQFSLICYVLHKFFDNLSVKSDILFFVIFLFFIEYNKTFVLFFVHFSTLKLSTKQLTKWISQCITYFYSISIHFSSTFLWITFFSCVYIFLTFCTFF